MATPSEELQIAVYQALINDAGVGALAGDHIYDGRRPEDFSACITFLSDPSGSMSLLPSG